MKATKRCARCREDKPAAEYRVTRTRAGKPRLHSYCKTCVPLYRKDLARRTAAARAVDGDS